MKNKLEMVALQIDLARQVESVQYIKDYIDFAKDNGYNTVFLYLEATVKVACVPFFNDDESYTPDEIREIVAYGNERGIDIIPALENLAHMENFFRHKELEDLSECKDADVDGRGIRSGRGDCICSNNPKAIEFFDTYYRQVMELFTSQYVHAGLDEPFDFAVCPVCTERMKNGATKADFFYEHVMHTYELVKSAGKTMMMWDDFFVYLDIADKLPRDIIMCMWNYSFIQDEVPGHWINCKKRDWLKYYDELGFRYIFCTYANKSGSLFNIDSLTQYADKYHPMGALMTAWIRTTNHYLCSYPTNAYAGRLWSGRIKESDRLKVYTEYIGNEEAADIVLNVHGGGGTYQPSNLQICENYTGGGYSGLLTNGYVMRRLYEILSNMEEGPQKDVLMDIYCFRLDCYLPQLQQKICLEVFDNYETRHKRPAYFIKQLEQMKAMSQEAYGFAKSLWAKYRDGVKSFEGKFDKHYQGRAKRYDAMIAELEKKEKHGVFYADWMQYCVYGTPRLIIEIHYKDKSVAPTVIHTNAKVVGGSNTVRMAMENKAVDYALFTLYGEGAVFPQNFRYTYGGKKYIASSVTKVEGLAKDLKHILSNDTLCAKMGTDDGMAHFNDLTVSQTRHTIKVKFKRLK